jgi:predicted glycoside hydrolase/deacetylase ChbG (UPF0249 family)
MSVEDGVLTIKVDLKKDFGLSKSGKTVIIASTEGNQRVTGTTATIGLNVYKSKGEGA